MKMFRTGLAALAATLTAATAVPAVAGTIFMGSYPDKLLVVDDATGSVTQRIPLPSGLPTSMRLSNDGRKIFVTTITSSGIEVLDVASKKIVNTVALNTPTTRYRFNGGVPDPTGRYFFTTLTRFDKEIDRYKVSKPMYAVVDLQTKKVARTAEVEAEDDKPGGGFRTTYQMSPNGKFVYLFRDKVLVLDAATLKVVERLDLAKPDVSGIENVSFGGGVEALRNPGQYISLFNATDPYVRNKVFGVGRFDLASRRFDFTPIGPIPTAMTGLQVTPDGKDGYTVVTHGTLGNKRCEFWHFDMASNKVLGKAEFHCRSRFQLGMSRDGAKLYIYGASYDIEVYDAKTLKHDYTWDLGNDSTGAGMIITP